MFLVEVNRWIALNQYKGQLAVVHHSVCRQRGLMPTFGATPTLVMADPIVLAATALLANNARLLTLSLEIRLAGGLSGKRWVNSNSFILQWNFKLGAKVSIFRDSAKFFGRLIADNHIKYRRH